MSNLANIKKLMNDTGHSSKIKSIIDDAKNAAYTEFFMGYPVIEELKVYAEGVLKAMPKVKFYPYDMCYISQPVNDDDGNYVTTRQFRVVDEFFVYMDDFPFDLGRIGYGDNAVSSGGKTGDTYHMYSRKVNNAKFATHRNQHHMKMTTDVDKAIKNASKYLLPYTHHELAKAYYEQMHNSVSQVLAKTETKLSHITSPIRSSSSLAILLEMESLLEQGITFVTPEFKELASQVTEAMTAYKEQKARKVSAYFVRLKPVGDETYADIQEVFSIRDNRWNERMLTNGALSASYPINELPQDVAGQISVLSILEDDGYVSNVGMKIDERTFWVERG